MKAHAVLAPSSAERWINCTRSARLEEKMPGKTSDAADEGTLAHSLGELLIRRKMGWTEILAFQQRHAIIQKNSFYNESMEEYAEDYAVYVMEKFTEAKAHTSDAMLFLEAKLDMTEYIPEGFGTGDAFVIADGVMDFIDLKYGKGVPVYAENNKQMMVYSLGALADMEHIYDIHTVRMTIFQPRIDNITIWEISVADLKKWAETVLKPRAAMAFKGEGDFAPGKHCRFCKVAATCKANADMNLKLAAYDFEESVFLKDEDIADILSRADTFSKWLSSVEEYALEEAVNNNKKWPGFKLVAGKSNRQYVDKEKVAAVLIEKGVKENIIYSTVLRGITALERDMGKTNFSDYLKGLIVKPPGKPTLVPEADKRPEFNSAENAQKDFANV